MRFALLLCFALLAAPGSALAQDAYQQMVQLFEQVKEFRQPLLSKKMLDYTAPAVAQRRAKIAEMRNALGRIDPSAWPVSRKVDYLLVRSQLDRLDFEYRVLRPWARDPGLYVDMVRDLAYTELPLQGEKLKEFRAALAQAPAVLQLARINLKEGAGELTRLALRNLEKHDGVGHGQPQRATPPEGVLGWYDDLAARVQKQQPELASEVEGARVAVREFHGWLRQNQARMTAPAGVGRENYTWYLKYVNFEPFTAEDVLFVGERELHRTLTGLKLEQFRNRGLPPLNAAESEQEYQRRIEEADKLVRQFIREKRFLTIPNFAQGDFDNNVPWMVRPGGRNFWEEVQFRDPLPDKVHAGIPGHRFDLLLHEHDQRPIRKDIVDGARVEGWGFYLEEAMMNAGLLADRPRTRELFWIFAAARAVRNKAEAMMHANQWTVDQAVRYMVENVPYMDENVARVDAEIYLREPTYGQNYQMGKVQIEKLLADRALQLGDKFDLGDFHDQFLAAGTIPVSLIRWEMTGLDDEVKEFWKK